MDELTESRITVVDYSYYQVSGEDPTLVHSKHTHRFKTDEQPYSRICKVGEDWEPLDSGWIEKVGLLILTNLSGKNPQRIPTSEEKALLASRILEVAFYPTAIDKPVAWLLDPLESLRARPSTLEGLSIRSRNGIVRYKVDIFPR